MFLPLNMLVRYLILRLCFLIPAILLAGKSYGTHNRAGEITYEQIADLTLRITITTYTKASSIAADRDSLDLYFGDGNFRRVARINGPNGRGENLGNDIKLNIYQTTYTYSGPGRYVLSMTDPNRNGGIINVNPPSSENVQFHLETVVVFLNPLFEGFNSSPILLNPPIEIGCVGQTFIHNPNAFDPDFDSLTYELIVPLQERDLQVPNYSFPNEIMPGANNNISLDPKTGNFIWESPQLQGEYNIAILIREFRNGREIGSVIRDLQILILECDNRPPMIEAPEEICVVAGEIISLNIVGTDPDFGQRIKMEATGGPFQASISPAELMVSPGYQNSPLNAVFYWETDCSHISDGFYNVLIKVEDNFFNTSGLSALKTIRIKVVGPPPLDLRAETISDQVRLSWESPYICEDIPNNYFRGFAIYRRNSSNNFERDTCNPGMEGKGYTLIANNVKNILNDRYIYVDETADKGRIYCYRIVAVFAKQTPAGIPFNRTESLASDEVCIQLNRDIPFMTKVSVGQTDPSLGIIEVKWSKPYLLDFDTLMNPGSYTFRLMRGQGYDPLVFEPIPDGVFTSTFFGTISDTSYVDTTGLNTLDFPYTYQVEFYVQEDQLYGISNPASSVYLELISTDRRIVLTWSEFTPWENYEYIIYRKNNLTGIFEPIDTTDQMPYTNRGLENGVEYCYKVETVGTYGITGIENPIFNFSQEICGIPIDTVPPCPPTLFAKNDCDKIDENSSPESLFNMLRWNDVSRACLDAEDTEGYIVYYKRFLESPYEKLVTIHMAGDTTYQHYPDNGLAGCYAVSSFDINGNESDLSNEVCLESCPSYILPNTFTPNNDGKNDLFIPRVNRFVATVEFKVFNIWGNLVFETNDPQLNWDGNNSNGQKLAEGTYYYTCRVFENKLDGITQQTTILSGYIELIR